ncbi:MAG: POTRA domain-containing protein [Pseudomonadota bacterium]
MERQFNQGKKNYLKPRLWFLYFLLFIIPIKGFAAVVPSTIAPGQVERQLRNTVPTPLTQATTTSFAEMPVTAPTVTPVPASMRISFVLRSVHITGSTVYAEESLRSFYRPYLNKRIGYRELEKIASSITLKYLKDGYLLSRTRIPIQNLSAGHVRIEIFEAYVANASIQGKTHGIENFLAAYIEKIKQSRPLQQETLQHYILLLNRLPGVKATLQLNPISENSGAQNLVFLIQQRRFSPYAILNNNQSRYLGSQNLFVTANMYSLLQGGDATTLTAATAPFEPRVLQYYYLYQVIPIGVYGNHLDILADYAQTKPNVLGQQANTPAPISSLTGKVGDLIGYYYHPFILQTNEKLEGRLALGYYISKSTGFNDPVNGPQDVKVHLPSLRAKAIYERTKPKYVDRIEAEISQGIHVAGAQVGPPAPNNPSIDYTKIFYYASHVQALPKSFSLLIDSMGQYAFNPLFPVEKIPYGGVPFGRAYDPSEIIGDQGIMGGLELRYTTFPQSFNAIQYFTRYDIGKVWNKNAAPAFALNSVYSDASLSAGLRLFLAKDFSLELSLAKPLTMPVQAQELSGHNGKSLRFFFNFSYTPL